MNHLNIKTTKSDQSRISEVDFENIPFGRTFSDHMFLADYKNGVWTDARIVPFGPLSLHPANPALHYGQSIFEGMKASKDMNGRALFFRPEMHAKRLNISAQRMCMPTFPEDLFMEALHQLISMEQSWIPNKVGSALYIRPLMFAVGDFIGVQPSENYKMMIFVGPVGPYYPKPVRLMVETNYVRAVKGGVGEAKAAGNYAASLLPAKLARQQGFDQLLWLDAKQHKYIQEVGTMNIFFVIDDKVITPSTDGAILKGITRDSIIRIFRDRDIAVEERPISIDELVEASESGNLQEAFGSGTAAVVAHVSDITFGEKLLQLPPVTDRKYGALAKSEIDGLRAGTVQDKYGWIVPVKSPVAANHL